VAPIASDRGVTPSSITVGFMLQNPSGLSDTGFSTGQRTDGPQYVQALADWATTQGGLNGRRITPVLRPTDPTSVEDQAAACRAMVDDVQAFAVIDVAALLDTPALDCVTNRTKGDTPLVHSVLWSRPWQQRSGGNEVSYQAAIDRISLTWARDLGAMRWFPEGATVGILGDKCPATEPTITGVLGPALMAQGAGKVVYGTHDCNISAVVGDPPNIATRFRLEGVTHVLLVSNFAAAQIFMTTAKSQGYRPKYSASDWFLNSADATTANFPPDQFDGAVGIASVGAMLLRSGKAPYPGWERCSKIATDAGLAAMSPDDPGSGELLGLCDNFLLFLDALHRAGPNPTRATWRAAVTTLGERTSVVFGPSRFGPGKLSGSDTVHTITWTAGCRCWRSTSDQRPAAA
jgi:ABC-type branched-subunit amino acid transport system substrate-binding protein